MNLNASQGTLRVPQEVSCKFPALGFGNEHYTFPPHVRLRTDSTTAVSAISNNS